MGGNKNMKDDSSSSSSSSESDDDVKLRAGHNNWPYMANKS